jgi:hypothetical protein
MDRVMIEDVRTCKTFIMLIQSATYARPLHPLLGPRCHKHAYQGGMNVHGSTMIELPDDKLMST